jgi:hypothetical protein
VAEERKPEHERKTAQIRIRISDAEKQAFREIARRYGLDLSAWLRMLGATEVVREERQEGRAGGRAKRQLRARGGVRP